MEDDSNLAQESQIESEQQAPQAKQKKRRPAWRETFDTVVGALLIALITRGAVAEPRYIPSGSMLPTLKINDRLIIEKLSNYTGSVHRGDILVFYPPMETRSHPATALTGAMRWLGLTGEEAYIKRVIGLPGESVEVHDGKVLVNGKALVEPYIQEAPAYDMAAITVPPDSLFMMGDNRNNSADSHVWGPLPEANIIGHASFRFWPLNRMGVVK